jgi:Fe-S oxidoreductase
MDSPRGRIVLMKGLAEGTLDYSDTVVGHFDRCLGCMACVTACPSGVKYDVLIEDTRAKIEEHHRRTLADKLHRKMIFTLFPYPRRLKALLVFLFLYSRSGQIAAVAVGAARRAHAGGERTPSDSLTAGAHPREGDEAREDRPPRWMRPTRLLPSSQRSNCPRAQR